MNKNLLIATAAVLALFSCKSSVKTEPEEITVEQNYVTVSEQSAILSKLTLDTVRVSTCHSQFRTVGTITAEPQNYAEVSVPFDGRITRTLVRLGQKVRAGEALFEFSSPEYYEAAKAYYRDLKNFERVKIDFERKKTLLEHGIISGKEMEEASVEYYTAKAEMETGESMMRAYGVRPEDVKMGQPLKIIAPIGGEIVKCNLTTGSFISSDAEAMVTIAKLDRVWATALIKEKYILNITRNCHAHIYSELNPDAYIEGKILNVGNMVDNETRSVQVVIECENTDRILKHGMYVSVDFISEDRKEILVPSTAVFQGNGTSYVYAATDRENVYERRDVRIDDTVAAKNEIAILDGLHDGEIIIMEGGLYLNN